MARSLAPEHIRILNNTEPGLMIHKDIELQGAILERMTLHFAYHFQMYRGMSETRCIKTMNRKKPSFKKHQQEDRLM